MASRAREPDRSPETRGQGGELICETILQDDGSLTPGSSCPFTDDELGEVYRLMLRSRLIDERGVSFQRSGRLGTYAESRGQEGASAGAAMALDPGTDWVVQTYRELPALIRQGMSPVHHWLQYIGHPDGWDFPETVKVTPMQIELATQLVFSVGLAWGMKLKGEQGVVLGCIGDGATSEGDFYEAGNLAGVVGAPLVIFCQNNNWAISTPISRQTRASTIGAKAAAFGIPAYVVDGNDVMGVFATVRDAVERARGGDGPSLIEARTYRMGAHNTSDEPSRYEPADVKESWSRRDPLTRLKTYLEACSLWSEESEAEFRESVLTEIDDAFRSALDRSAVREPGMLFEHLYKNPPDRVVQQRSDLESQSR